LTYSYLRYLLYLLYSYRYVTCFAVTCIRTWYSVLYYHKIGQNTRAK
jgi:hypothetical protein